jgi:hypothetical protein
LLCGEVTIREPAMRVPCHKVAGDRAQREGEETARPRLSIQA